jgi:hypothetical protein
MQQFGKKDKSSERKYFRKEKMCKDLRMLQ